MLQLIEVTKTFPGHSHPILNRLSLSFYANEFCVIIGSNGSGKSTLLGTIAGEHVLDNGEIRLSHDLVENKNFSIATVRQDINEGTVPNMTLLENVVLGCLRKQKARLRPYHSHRETAIKMIQSLEMDLERYLHTPLKYLSGGQRQMVATLISIQSQPKILLLDEHTSALDPKTQSMLMAFTAKAIEQTQILTLMVTHRLEDAIRYGNRLIMLDRGQVVLDVSHEQKKVLSRKTLLDLFCSLGE